MTITTRPFTTAERRSELRSLARRWDDTGEAVREIALAHFARPLPPQALTQAWEEYRDAQRTADALEAGEMGWADWNENLSCAGRQDVAVEEAAMWAAGALDVLVRGEAA